MAEASKEWYGVKGLFRWYFKDSGKTSCIEERVVLFQATSFDQALDMAEKEATNYCQNDPEANFSIESLGWWNVYWIGEEMPVTGVEVYARLSDTSLSGDSFIRRYYPKSHVHTPKK